MSTVLSAPAPPPSRARLRRGDLVPAPPQAQPGVERDEDGVLWLLPTHQDSPPAGYYASSLYDVRLSDGAMRLLPIEVSTADSSVFGGGGSDVEDEEEDVYRYARQQAEQVAHEQEQQARQQRRAHEVSYRRRRALWWVAGGSLAVVALLATPPAQDVLQDAYTQVVEVEKERDFTVPAELLD